MNRSLNLLSLFSGCGGMDLGFEGDFDVLSSSIDDLVREKSTANSNKWVHLKHTSFHTIFANDIREDAKTAWVQYFKQKGIDDSIYHTDSIVDLVKRYRSGDKTVFPQNVDIVTGGFPCQDFSVSGKRLGFHSNKNHLGKVDVDCPSVETRGQLYIWMKEVIEITQPKIFVAENVKGLTNLHDVVNIIQNDFSSIGGNGYIVVPPQVLKAAEYGVPQSRERVIFIGFKKSALKADALKELSANVISDKYDPYPTATHYVDDYDEISLFGRRKRFVTTKTALQGLDEPEKSTDLSQKKYSHAKYMGNHCQGQTEIKLDSIAPTIRSEHHGNIEFRRLSEEHGGTHSEELQLGMKERRLTIRECARLQTFPDDYQFVFNKTSEHPALSASNAYKLIGNAVPPLLAYHIARRLEENWDLYFK